MFIESNVYQAVVYQSEQKKNGVSNQGLNDDGDREKMAHVKFNLAKVHYCKLKSSPSIQVGSGAKLAG